MLVLLVILFTIKFYARNNIFNSFLSVFKLVDYTSWFIARSSFPEVFCKNGVLTNFAKFTGKHLCQSFFFNKVAGLRPLRIPFLTEHLRWLLLYYHAFQTFSTSISISRFLATLKQSFRNSKVAFGKNIPLKTISWL